MKDTDLRPWLPPTSAIWRRGILMALFLCAAACKPAKLEGLPPPNANAVKITFETQPKGGALVVDGVPLGPAPRVVPLNPGPHLVKATMSGYFSNEQRLQVSSGAPRTVQLVLVASH